MSSRTLLVVVLLSAVPALGEIDLIAKAPIPGSARDLSELPHRAESCPPDRLGGFGSAIASTTNPQRFIALTDRGPGDGAAAFRCRFQTFDLTLSPTSAGHFDLNVALVGTTLLSRSDGRAFTGNTGAYNTTDPIKSLRLDPEGLRVSPEGTLYISDEYGPWIDEFSIDGRQLRRFSIPSAFLNRLPDGDPAIEAKQATGRQPNRGFEGLAIAPDGSLLFAILQGPLLQDIALNAAGKREGLNIRILQLEPSTGATRQFVYQLAFSNDGISEILAVNEHELLVLERDGKAGDDARRRALYRIDLANATDVSSIEALPSHTLPESITPVAKSLFLDFMDPRFALAAPDMPEKIEGMCFGPTLADGRHTIIVTTDNDLKEDQASWFWVFAFNASDLPNLKPQVFSHSQPPTHP